MFTNTSTGNCGIWCASATEYEKTDKCVTPQRRGEPHKIYSNSSFHYIFVSLLCLAACA